MLEAGVQLGTAIQAQTLARVEDNLVEHEASLEKIANAQGAGFARVDDDLDLMGKRINMVKVDVDSVEESIKSVLECLEVLERENVAKDKLINDLCRHVTTLSEALGERSGGEDVNKISSGSGSRDNPFELEDDKEETWSDCPQGGSPDAEEATSLLSKHEPKVMASYPRGGILEERREDDILMKRLEEGGLEMSSDGELLVLRNIMLPC